MQDGKLIIKLIDFDASATYGELCHLKFSSAYAPPQLAAELLARSRAAVRHLGGGAVCQRSNLRASGKSGRSVEV